ncbi:MAG: SPOR domain-containing protein [Bacteroidales bacterium]|nr:SPOR domain-containing protein [Bacteroidales bacterium]
MDVPFYISELLYEHDCVILPGFGGFVTQYAPAKIHPINHTFYPPSKNILFNSRLTRDDGLLIDFIAGKENKNYDEASREVNTFIDHIRAKLENDEKVVLKNIGSFKKDIEGNLLFNPTDNVNYLEESFGLTTFISPPIIRKPVHKRLEKKFMDRKPAPVKDNKRRKAFWIPIVVLPVLIFMGWYLFFHELNTGNDLQQTGMVNLDEVPDQPLSANKAETEAAEKSGPPLKTLDFKENKKPAEVEVAEPQKTPVVKPSKMYNIIGGAFSSEANAEKFVAVLRKRGYDAIRAGISPSGLHMVAYHVTADKEEALLNLEMIRKNENPSAWLIRK